MPTSESRPGGGPVLEAEGHAGDARGTGSRSSGERRRRRRRSATRLPRLRRRLLLTALGPLTLVLFQGAALVPGAVEVAYADGVGTLGIRLLSRLTGWVPFTAAELVMMGALLWVVLAAAQEARRVRRRRLGRRWGVLSWLLRLAQVAGVAIFLFYGLWGLNYARPPLESRLGWAEVVDVPASELEALAVEAVTATNRAYRELHGTEDLGRPTPGPPSPRVLESSLRAGWMEAARELNLAPALAARYGPPKEPLFSGALNRVGIFGFFFPFTGEPIVNADLPGVAVPATAAHEQAHQRGIAPEDEASFMAAMATIRSPDPFLRYSGWAFAQRRLVSSLGAVDREAARRVAETLLPGVRRDQQELRRFSLSLQGPVNEVADRVNDAYLRSNRVEGGIRSYGLVTRLLVAHARIREQAGEPFPE